MIDRIVEMSEQQRKYYRDLLAGREASELRASIRGTLDSFRANSRDLPEPDVPTVRPSTRDRRTRTQPGSRYSRLSRLEITGVGASRSSDSRILRVSS